MVQNSLVKYIQEQIRAGYDIGTIKAYLIRYGYAETQINEAIQFAYPPTEVKHVLHFSKITIVLVVAIVCSLVLASLGFFFFMGDKGAAQLLDVKTEMVSSSINEGDNARFTVELSNLGKAKRYDVHVRYEVRSSGNTLITFKEETIAVETKASSTVSLGLGGAGVGSYTIKTTANYKGGSAKATSSFKIVKKSSGELPVTPQEPTQPVKKCPFNCNDGNECTNDYCNEVTNYECRHDKKFPCCGNEICEDGEDYNNCLADCKAPADKVESMFEGKTPWEKIDIIKSIAKSDKEKAIGYCKDIEQNVYKYECFTGVGVSSQDKSACLNIEDDISRDTCYRSVAVESKQSDICADISKESKRDQCYMDFATKGDYSVCGNIVNKYLKQSCENLKQLSEMPAPG